MQIKLFILFLLLVSIGCNNDKMTHRDIVTQYYNALNSGNHNEIQASINDIVTFISGDYVTSYNRDEFYEFFKWDSVFKPSYRILELEVKNNEVIASVAQENARNEYLRNNPLVYKVKVYFESGKISKVEDLDYMDVNWETWSHKRDTLVSWIRNNHPNLDGFVNDITMEGAIDYLKAIELFSSSQEN
ncbi:hypothetical protein [Flagellimonas marina]|uniref:SnoaL-like domain-containing protein n=1 Tax=Flagellimonas marina TaxID=1775168 RepID=A0ABV8PQH0_9FLAO